ncbi:MAG: PEP-CTERM sorting domain-containing protein [Rubrivivax sp.]|nr:MAG: PEP-CTERM sorting domain-containing protein [Rubrivivax sp.]
MQHHRSRLAHFMAGLGLAIASLSASAEFSGDITVKLLTPGGTVSDATPFTLTQTVLAADLADGVRAGNLGGSGDISGFMLDDERIFFSGNSILLRVAAGATVSGALVTGYLAGGFDPARYEITGLAIPGQLITGYTVTAFDGFAAAGSTGLLAPAQASDLVFLFNGNAASFNLDSIVFVNRFAGESDNYAEFRIDLITTPVPEPATAVLLMAGGLWLRLRLRKP